MTRADPPDPRSTKTRILDAAEELFAIRGYDGVSLREITQAAGVEVALANYHFGPKEELFRQVIHRRVAVHCDGVLAALDAAQVAAAAGGRIASVEDVVGAFCRYTFTKTVTGGLGWKRYFQLLSRTALSPVYAPVLAPLNKPYGVIVRRYVAAFQAALPTLPPGHLYTAFYFLQAMVSRLLAETQVLDRQSQGRCHAADFEAHLARLVPFAAAGFYALAGRPDVSPSPGFEVGVPSEGPGRAATRDPAAATGPATSL
ncbi:MAG: TetR/AcrR family transcriptional regulator [Pseudomonadota bacterium]